MSLQIDVVRSTDKKRRINKKNNLIKFDKLAAVIPVAIAMILLTATTSLIAHFDSKRNVLNKKKESIESEIHNIEREIENTKNRIEAASGGNVKRQITRLKLGLDLPKWKQRRPLDIGSMLNAKTKGKQQALAKKDISQPGGL